MSETPSTTSTATSESRHAVTAAVLSSLRTRIRILLVAQRTAFVFSAMTVALSLFAIADFAIRFPTALRWCMWFAALGMLCWAVHRYLLPALRFRPSLTELALRLEHAGHAPRGVLASGLELGVDASAPPELASRAAEAASRAAIAKMRGVYNLNRLRDAVIGVFTCGLALSVSLSIAPELSMIGARRVLTPWTDTSWPKRTSVADVLEGEAFPRGRPLALRAQVTKYPSDPANADVATDVNVSVNGVDVYRGRVLLALQHSNHGEAAPTFERLLDIDALLPPTVNANDRVEVQYSHSTSDDRTEPRRVLMVEPPSVVETRLVAIPPEYLAGVTTRSESMLGKGTDDRAFAGPFFAGSRIQLEVMFNKSIAAPNNDTEAALKSIIPALVGQSELQATLEASTWKITWTATKSLQIAVNPIDEFGLTSATEHLYRVDITDDAAPSATVVEPSQDESVLATADVDVSGEGRDDVGMHSVKVAMSVARRPGDSEGAPPDAEEMERYIAEASTSAEQPTATRATAKLALKDFSLSEGDEVRLVSEVRDLKIAATPEGTPIRSAARRLKIISESSFAEQIQNDLSNVREAAKRLVKEQSAISGAREQAVRDPEQAREQVSRQDAVSDRLNPMSNTIKRLRAKVDRNNPGDESIDRLLEDAEGAASAARESSGRASTALDSLSRKSANDTTDTDARELEESQNRIENSLDDLVRMLERGRDGWAVRRALERIVTEQRQLADQTSAAGRELQGRSANDLNTSEREDLNRRAQKQQELAQRTRAMIDSMEEQARAMEQADPGLSTSMKSAAQTGRREQIAQQQEDAAKKIRENQTGSAQDGQREATRNLEKMLSELDRAQQRRDEALRRTVAELQESLERLRTMQSGELERLAMKVRVGGEEKLDAGMIAVNRATIDAIGKAESMSESATVPELLRSASTAQESAISILRKNDPDFAEADANERRSLARINEAIEELNKIDEDAKDREEQRAREELAKVYAQALEQQIALNVQVDPMIGKAPGRRERAALMQIGTEQESLRAMLAEQLTKTDGLEDAKVFRYAHERLDEAMLDAAALLSKADPTLTLKRRQTTAARVLGSLVQALRNEPQKDDGLRENEGGDDSGGGGGGAAKKGLLPPGTELKLLRMMQHEAMERTRALSEEGAQDETELQAVSKLQGELHRRAAELLETLSAPEGEEPQPEDRP